MRGIYTHIDRCVCTWEAYIHISPHLIWEAWSAISSFDMRGEVGGWGRDPKKCTGRDWGMGSSTIQWNLRPVVKYHLRRGVGFTKFLENGSRPQPPTSLWEAWSAISFISHISMSTHINQQLNIYMVESHILMKTTTWMIIDMCGSYVCSFLCVAHPWPMKTCEMKEIADRNEGDRR